MGDQAAADGDEARAAVLTVRTVGRSGTFSSVRRCSDGSAAKTLCRCPATDQPALAAAEAELLRRCAHEHVVLLLGTRLDASARCVLLLEWCDADLGAVLAARRARSDPLPEAAAKAVALGLLRGLAAVHERGVMHRDVKPANLLLAPDGRVKLGDFGSAGLVDPDKDQALAPTTRWYRAPELLYGAVRYGPPVDAWSAGATLGEVMSLAPLLPGGSDIDQLAKIHALLGRPLAGEAAWLSRTPHFGSVAFHPTPAPGVAGALAGCPPLGVQLVAALLRFSGPDRLSAEAAAGCDWFTHPPAPLPWPELRECCLQAAA